MVTLVHAIVNLGYIAAGWWLVSRIHVKCLKKTSWSFVWIGLTFANILFLIGLFIFDIPIVLFGTDQAIADPELMKEKWFLAPLVPIGLFFITFPIELLCLKLTGKLDQTEEEDPAVVHGNIVRQAMDQVLDRFERNEITRLDFSINMRGNVGELAGRIVGRRWKRGFRELLDRWSELDKEAFDDGRVALNAKEEAEKERILNEIRKKIQELRRILEKKSIS